MSGVPGEPLTSAEIVDRIEALDGDELQRLLTVALRAYAERIVENGGAPFPAFSHAEPLTATEALLVAGEILRAAEISSFELATMLNI